MHPSAVQKDSEDLLEMHPVDKHAAANPAAEAAAVAAVEAATIPALIRFRYEWADPYVTLYSRNCTQNAVRTAWLNGGAPGVQRLLDEDGGASIHASRLRSVSTGGHIVWSNAALQAAGSTEPDGSLGSPNHYGLRKRHREEAGPEAGPGGSALLPRRTSPDALIAPASVAAPSLSSEHCVARLEEPPKNAGLPPFVPLEAAGITGMVSAAVSRDPRITRPTAPMLQASPAAVAPSPAALCSQLRAPSSHMRDALCAPTEHKQAEPQLDADEAAVAATPPPHRPSSALPSAHGKDEQMPAKEPRQVSPMNPFGADRAASGIVEERGQRSGAAGLPGPAAGGKTAVQNASGAAVHPVGAADVSVAGAPQGPGGAGADAAASPMQLHGVAPPLPSQASEDDDVVLEALLRTAAKVAAGKTGDKSPLLHAVTAWFDRWEGIRHAN